MKVFLTIFQLVWAYVWAVKHMEVRREQTYARGRVRSASSKSYRAMSYLVYGFQNALCIACFWSSAGLLFKIHESNNIRLWGAGLIVSSTALYFKSLHYLGRNYSPCYDSHVPHELISSGPYKIIRHPMYLAKLILIIGTFLISGSLLIIPMFIWLFAEIKRSIASEELYLAAAIPDYVEYKKRTKKVIPFVL